MAEVKDQLKWLQIKWADRPEWKSVLQLGATDNEPCALRWARTIHDATTNRYRTGIVPEAEYRVSE